MNIAYDSACGFCKNNSFLKTFFLDERNMRILHEGLMDGLGLKYAKLRTLSF